MRIMLFALGASILLAQEAPSPVVTGADPVVLTIGTEKITRSMFEQILTTLPPQQQAQLSTPEAKRSLAEQIAELKIMAQEGRSRKIDQLPDIRAKIALNSEQIIANAVYQQLVAGDPDEAALKTYYEQHKADWDEIKAKHILIRMKGSQVPVREGQKELSDEEALAKAKDLRAKIVAGANFEEIAKKESDDTGSGENGGELGMFAKGQMVPQFEDAALAAKVGEVTQPVKTQYGYHLILVEERKPKSFEDARGEISQRIRPELGQKAIDALKAKTPITFDDQYFGKK